jgi:DnaJ-class molecular chaperone
VVVMTDDKLIQLAREVTDMADEARDLCPTCEGTGMCTSDETFECPDCGGEGYVEI